MTGAPLPGQAKAKECLPLDYFKAIVREFHPDATDDQVLKILWEYTGYPSFWRSGNPGLECRQQLKAWAEEIQALLRPVQA